jgi:predicted unusual protein kinase regulating ubiquinone biosynthesis (AarF/ABC1/UbiB family)
MAISNTVRLNPGQVHRAKLRGKEVVVKVQRPGLKALFDIDLKNLRVSTI